MATLPAANEDTDSLLAEALAFDAEHRGPTAYLADRANDPALLINLCRALEREAASGLAGLEQRDLVGLHGSLELMKQQIEDLLKRR